MIVLVLVTSSRSASEKDPAKISYNYFFAETKGEKAYLLDFSDFAGESSISNVDSRANLNGLWESLV